MKSSRGAGVVATLFSLCVVALGYVLLGPVPSLLFSFGFVGGLALWLVRPEDVSFERIRWPYYVSLGLFVLHKVEERRMGFFPALAEITGRPVPDPGSFLAVLLYGFAGAWLAVPCLLRRRNSFGGYLAWTFFTSMGVIELAHFVFPFFRPGAYGYFPGMATVIPLAPFAWWGMWRMWIACDSQNA
jgi:hypothetical protein